MRLVNPAPILLGDQHHEANVDRSVLAASDVAPYLPRAEVIFAGHAYAPTPSPFVPVRLAVVGSRPLIDKTLHVYGERMWMDGDQMTAPVPFTRIPIRYERAFRGPNGFEENPVGMAKGAGLPVHNVIDPADPEAPAGLGPIAPYWPPRRRLLRNLDPGVVQATQPDLPDTFAWSFFHAAPPDQRCSFLECNEWVVLEGLHPEHPRFESQLPSARARARLYTLDNTSHREIVLTADTLWIDGDRSLCCVLYRGNFEIESETMLHSVQLFAGLELPGRLIPWPDATTPDARASQVAAERPSAERVSAEQRASNPHQSGEHAATPQSVAGSTPPQAPHGPSPQAQLNAALAAAAPNTSDTTLQSTTPLRPGQNPVAARPPSGQYVAVNPSPRPPSGQYAAVSGTPVPMGAGASHSLLAALAQDASSASTLQQQPQPLAASMPPPVAGTLASPGAMAQAVAMARGESAPVAVQQPLVAPESVGTRPQESDPYVQVNAAWLEEPSSPSTNPVLPATTNNTPSSPPATKPAPNMPPSRLPMSGGNTLTQAPSELRGLIENMSSVPSAAPTVAVPNVAPVAAPAEPRKPIEERGPAVTTRHIHFEDAPTLAPDTSDLARILAEAEQRAAQTEAVQPAAPPPVAAGTRPSPHALRAQKTTIRGLGGLTRGNDPFTHSESPPPTARASVQQHNVHHNEESPTAQLPVPEILLKLASQQPASSRDPINLPNEVKSIEVKGEIFGPEGTLAVPPAQLQAAADLAFSDEAPPTRQVDTRALLASANIAVPTMTAAPIADLDDDDMGRPTLSGMEAPPVTMATPPQVHKDEARMDLERRIREGETLEGLDLSDLDLSGFDLSGKRLVGCRFDRSNLKRGRFCGADLSGASFEGADLAEAALDDAVLERANLVSAKLYGSSMRRALLTDANLTTADVRRAVLDEASGQRTVFCRARLDGASAIGVKLDTADFTEAQLDGANFTGSLMPELRAYEVSAEDAIFERSVIQNARFDGGVLSRARFDGAHAEDSMWDRAVLDGVSFARARLTGASFTKASLRKAHLDGAELAEARFNRANLSGAHFLGVDLSHLTLDGADLTGIVTND